MADKSRDDMPPRDACGDDISPEDLRAAQKIYT
jgi:hypothetical protein